MSSSPHDLGRNQTDAEKEKEKYQRAVKRLKRVQAKIIYQQQIVITKRKYLENLNNKLAKLIFANRLLRSPDYLYLVYLHLQYDLGTELQSVSWKFNHTAKYIIDLVASFIYGKVLLEPLWKISKAWGGWGKLADGITDALRSGRVRLGRGVQASRNWANEQAEALSRLWVGRQDHRATVDLRQEARRQDYANIVGRRANNDPDAPTEDNNLLELRQEQNPLPEKIDDHRVPIEDGAIETSNRELAQVLNSISDEMSGDDRVLENQLNPSRQPGNDELDLALQEERMADPGDPNLVPDIAQLEPQPDALAVREAAVRDVAQVGDDGLAAFFRPATARLRAIWNSITVNPDSPDITEAKKIWAENRKKIVGGLFGLITIILVTDFFEGVMEGKKEAEAWKKAREGVENRIQNAMRLAVHFNNIHANLVSYINATFNALLGLLMLANQRDSRAFIDIERFNKMVSTNHQWMQDTACVSDGYLASELLEQVKLYESAQNTPPKPQWNVDIDTFDISEKIVSVDQNCTFSITHFPTNIRLLLQKAEVITSEGEDIVSTTNIDQNNYSIDIAQRKITLTAPTLQSLTLSSKCYLVVTYTTKSIYKLYEEIADNLLTQWQFLIYVRQFVTTYYVTAAGENALIRALDQMRIGTIVEKTHFYVSNTRVDSLIGSASLCYDDSQFKSQSQYVQFKPSDTITLTGDISIDNIGPLEEGIYKPLFGKFLKIKVNGHDDFYYIPLADVDLTKLPQKITIKRQTWASKEKPTQALPTVNDGKLRAVDNTEIDATSIQQGNDMVSQLAVGTKVYAVRENNGVYVQKGDFLQVQLEDAPDAAKYWVLVQKVNRRESEALQSFVINTVTEFGKRYIDSLASGEWGLQDPPANVDKAEPLAVGNWIRPSYLNALIALSAASDIVYHHTLLDALSISSHPGQQVTTDAQRREAATRSLNALRNKTDWQDLDPSMHDWLQKNINGNG